MLYVLVCETLPHNTFRKSDDTGSLMFIDSFDLSLRHLFLFIYFNVLPPPTTHDSVAPSQKDAGHALLISYILAAIGPHIGPLIDYFIWRCVQKCPGLFPATTPGK